nr:MAG TPA: hypothetical protein [Caudoviricetes sp.]
MTRILRRNYIVSIIYRYKCSLRKRQVTAE